MRFFFQCHLTCFFFVLFLFFFKMFHHSWRGCTCTSWRMKVNVLARVGWWNSPRDEGLPDTNRHVLEMFTVLHVNRITVKRACGNLLAWSALGAQRCYEWVACDSLFYGMWVNSISTGLRGRRCTAYIHRFPPDCLISCVKMAPVTNKILHQLLKP